MRALLSGMLLIVLFVQIPQEQVLTLGPYGEVRLLSSDERYEEDIGKSSKNFSSRIWSIEGCKND